MQELMSNRRVQIAIAVSIGVLLLIGWLLVVVNGQLTRNPYGDSVAIQGYDQNIKNLSPDYKNNITAALYKTIRLNTNENITVSEIGNAVIRSGSDTQTVITENQQYTGKFIVDLEKIKQSYLVQYEYTSLPGDDFNSGYPILVSCLDTDELIYGEFYCRDLQQQEVKLLDPIVDILPHETLDYSIRSIINKDETVTISITIKLSGADYRGNTEQIIATRKQVALNWIQSQGFNPNDYKIEYTN